MRREDIARLEALLAAVEQADAAHRARKDDPNAGEDDLIATWHEWISSCRDLERGLMRHAAALIAAARKVEDV